MSSLISFVIFICFIMLHVRPKYIDQKENQVSPDIISLFFDSPNHPLHIFSKMVSYIPVIWCVTDSVLGPRYMLGNFNSKSYFKYWTFVLILELLVKIATGNFQDICIMILSAVATMIIWKHIGKPLWTQMNILIYLDTIYLIQKVWKIHKQRVYVTKICITVCTICLLLGNSQFSNFKIFGFIFVVIVMKKLSLTMFLGIVGGMNILTITGEFLNMNLISVQLKQENKKLRKSIARRAS